MKVRDSLLGRQAVTRSPPGIDRLWEPIEQVFLLFTLRWQKLSRAPAIRFRSLLPMVSESFGHKISRNS